MKSLKEVSARLFRVFNPVRLFLINLTWVLAIVIGAIYIGISYRNNTLMLQSIRDQASSFFDLIVKTRTWNAEYGGIYVEKKPGVETNPYLSGLGVEPEIKTIDGRVLTMRNPAMMTRELSIISERDAGVQFHITSLKLVNTSNKPDQFEVDSLKLFDRGAKEAWQVERTGGDSRFRFMKPLIVQEACLKCHANMGYKVGDVRGGISISIPFSAVDREMRTNRWIIFAFSVLTLAIILGALYCMASQMVDKLELTQNRLREVSITDALTGMKNRGYIMDRLEEEFQRSKRLLSPLGLIMMDIDFFKKINDTYGHQFGDVVLRTVARRIMAGLRTYDVAGRYGGEEFLIIVPGATRIELTELAERLRESTKAEKISDRGGEIRVTISVGVTEILIEDETYETMISRSDSALYTAKQEGRDRVIVD